MFDIHSETHVGKTKMWEIEQSMRDFVLIIELIKKC
jgi:hypothetical protein